MAGRKKDKSNSLKATSDAVIIESQGTSESAGNNHISFPVVGSRLNNWGTLMK